MLVDTAVPLIMKFRHSAIIALLLLDHCSSIAQAFQAGNFLTVPATTGSITKSPCHPRRKHLADGVFQCKLSPSVATCPITRMSSYEHPFEGSGMTLGEEQEEQKEEKNLYQQSGDANSKESSDSMPEQSRHGIYQIKNEEQYK